ncbi:MAG: MBL fold metallo-hydrolase [Pseudobutyrivibrio sp.]|nr:MBL fold metallo-hydrolase [Pseudobutyrivibrio sp.]
MTKVYYLMHSSFIVELQDRYLLFDYFDKNQVTSTVDYKGGLPLLDDSKHLYVFASNNRKDHYTDEVLNWAKDRDNITYIFSKDIKISNGLLGGILSGGTPDYLKGKMHRVSSMSKYEIDDMTIETLRSTEAGVSFVINVCDLNIYYAGNNNWWNAEGRGELYAEQYGREYKRSLRPYLNRHFDLAFVLLDSRMGEDGYYLGLDYFIKNIDCECIFPMQMWGDYKWIDRFKSRPDISTLRDRVIDIDRENMIFELED